MDYYEKFENALCKQKEYQNLTPFQLAVVFDRLDLVEEHLHECWNQLDGHSRTILQLALLHNSTKVIDKILRATMSDYTVRKLFMMQDDNGDTALLTAARMYNKASQIYCQHDTAFRLEFSIANKAGENYIMLICMNNRVDLAKQLKDFYDLEVFMGNGT